MSDHETSDAGQDVHEALDVILQNLRRTSRPSFAKLFGQRALADLTPVELQGAFQMTLLEHDLSVSPSGALGRALFDFYLAALSDGAD